MKMNSLASPYKPYSFNNFHPTFHHNQSNPFHIRSLKLPFQNRPILGKFVGLKTLQVVRAYNGDDNIDQNAEEEQQENRQRQGFLSLEEAGLVEISGLNTHERFLARLTISSLNLLRVIAEQEGCSIEELNAGRICDWFLKDKLKREQNIGSAVLQWEDDDPFDLL